ncbi:hypothetical protein Q3W71_13430 [Micromonospora sp. C28SCA-DRY-2]|uniref:hypothetical protein n=1 Tax=Micromonospora sp. C28SCA-DRY-2 TaxID=3059522 RepID=UPI0026771EE6|nr:hypothetical protein [Micromonospora sp. C28SCA-DRY-2]MDO3702671.1 hypothetical protein [Micromonospora sp. C28SCA-DRY-2]
MSESGQPGAATPGEHGDGTGQQDDLARTGNGWAPAPAGWARSGETGGSREPAPSWRQPDPALGWGASSPRHGDLPPPLPGLPADAPATRAANGRHTNGVGQHPTEPPADRSAPISAPPGRATPVSAPPGLLGEPRRDSDGDRLVVPAQRPAPAAEQPAPPHGLAEPEPGPARHASDDPSAGRPNRWAEPGPPTSAPPAVQVPPVGTTASGFEVPPGFHAPTVDRSAAGEPPSAVDPRGWGDPFPPEQPAAEPRPGTPGTDRTAGLDRALTAGEPAGPAATPPTDRTPPAEPDWSGPNWNRPSWGSGWAPSWAREEATESTGRRARDESTPGWASEPNRPYEPVRAEPVHPYEPPRPEPTRPYQPSRAEAEQRPPAEQRPSAEQRAAYEPPAEQRAAYEPPAERRPAYEPPAAPAERPAPAPAERPSWAGGPPAAVPSSAPPSPYAPEAAASSPPEDEPRNMRPFRFRSAESASAPPEPPGDPSTGPATAPATSGDARRDRTPPAPAPTSAPPYAARRSAPEPVPTARPAEDGLPDRTSAVLPQRVPAEPDVPVVPEPPAVEPSAETPELARIATHLRRDDEPAPMRERPEGFDVNAILDAVREVAGVRDAALRRTPAGAHSLRLDLADGADPAEVSRQVARLLQERMGLAAAPQNVPGLPTTPPPPVRRRSAEPRPVESRSAEPRAAESRAERAVEPRAAEARSAPPAADPRVPGARPETGPTRAERRAEPEPEVTPRRRRQSAAPHRGRATVEEPGSVSAAPAGTATGSPATVGSYSGGQVTTTETAPSRPLATGGTSGPRVVIDHVQVSTFGLDATVEVRLVAGGQNATGYSTGPAVDGFVLRLCAVAAAAAVDELLRGAVSAPERGRCFVEHAAVVPFGNCEVATVVVLLVCDGWVEQLAGSALVAGDPRQAVVRATLAAVNRRLEALLA